MCFCSWTEVLLKLELFLLREMRTLDSVWEDVWVCVCVCVREREREREREVERERRR